MTMENEDKTPRSTSLDDDDLRSLMLNRASQLGDRLARVLIETFKRSELFERIEALSSGLAAIAAIEDTPRTSRTAPEPADSSSRKDKKTCSEPGCEQPSRAKGLCSKHYQRLRYAEKRAAEEGAPMPSSLSDAKLNRGKKRSRKTPKRGGGTCSVADCESPNYAKDMCGKHFMEWVRSRKNSS